MTDDWIAVARLLVQASRNRPRQTELKRAVSTAYYAVFHALAAQCADLFVGVGPNKHTSAWTQVYRALEHGFAKSACQHVQTLDLPQGILNFAKAFVRLQDERHRADYDPNVRFRRAEALLLISMAEEAIKDLKRAPAKDRTALAAFVLLKRRPQGG